ncbi:hypothetical protein ABFY09_09835 [Marinomonas sp. 5E14-1]|uniref:hypothetical protein n=1 Tax=Marinomonas sp. 5E14-1 TaxID=3153922 RepID=UPI0032647258
MFRELTPNEAFQTHCLAQMGVASWLSAPEGVAGTVFSPAQPWAVTGVDSVIELPSDSVFSSAEQSTDIGGFGAAIPEPIVKVLPEEKEKSVNYLREQLNAGPEIIVEDLQPIEELAVDIAVEAQPETKHQMMHLDIRAYALSNKLLILSDVPHVFSQAEDIERLALKMGQALLKESVEEWQSSAFSWPDALKNPHFLGRSDWLFGAVESYVGRLANSFSDAPMLVLAGNQITQLIDDLPENSVLKQYPTARIVSLPELYRIPELRKDAWQAMQASFFRDKR